MPPESTIYVQLLGEAVDVWRPVTAIHEAEDTYRLPDEQPETETWAFPPGSRVRCKRRTIEGTSELVACSLADQSAELSEWQAWWKREGRDNLNALLLTEWNPIGTRSRQTSTQATPGRLADCFTNEAQRLTSGLTCTASELSEWNFAPTTTAIVVSPLRSLRGTRTRLHRRGLPQDPRPRNQRFPGPSSMGLVEALSNHEIQERLRRLSEKLDLLTAKGAAPRHSARLDRRLRSGLVPDAILRVLSDSVEPMRMKDIHSEVEAILGQPVSRSAVKNWLANHVQGEQALFVRLGRGRYLVASGNPRGR